MFRPSAIRLAQHVPGTRGLKFPDRKAKAEPHQLAPHPCAPQSVIDRFPEWMKAQQADSGSFSSYGSSGDKSSGGKTASSKSRSGGSGAGSAPSQGKGASGGSSSSSSGAGVVLEEWELPAHLTRGRYAPSEAECEAVDSGGASVSPVVTKGTWEKWHLAQI